MKKTIIFGHRGYPAHFAENSLEGFRYVVDHHAEGVEFDVHLTKDQVPVIMHDEQIDRTTDGKGYIKNFTFNELRKFKLANGEPIPTLTELLAVLANVDIQINLEFKTNIIHYHDIEQIVFEEIKQFNFTHPVIFSSFNLQTLRNCYQLEPHNKYCFLKEFHLFNAASLIKREHLCGVHLHHYQRLSGITQRIWTVDNVDEALNLFRKEVDGIFTNDFVKMQALRDEFFERCI